MDASFFPANTVPKLRRVMDHHTFQIKNQTDIDLLGNGFKGPAAKITKWRAMKSINIALSSLPTPSTTFGCGLGACGEVCGGLCSMGEKYFILFLARLYLAHEDRSTSGHSLLHGYGNSSVRVSVG